MNRLAIALLLTTSGNAAFGQSMSPREAMDGRSGGYCPAQRGPGFTVRIDGMKDRTGRLMAELYPATDEDFLKRSDELQRDGKVFRRVTVVPAQRGPVTLCIDAPAPGRYALVLIHDRDGKRKFDIWKDGIALPGNQRLGRRRPTVGEATIGTAQNRPMLDVRMQYMRGLAGFGPLGG